jgi:Bacteriophage lambda head decoration protein D
MPTLTEGKTLQDVLIMEVDFRYNRDMVTFTNNTGATKTFPIGTVLVAAGTPVAAAGEANSALILAEEIKDLANNGTKKVSVIARSPAIINQDQLVYTGLTAATVKTALAGRGFKLVSEPVKVTTQTM